MSQSCEEFLFTWKIKNYFFCELDVDYSLPVKIPNLKSFHESEWIIYLYPRGPDICVNYVCLTLLRTTAGKYHKSLAVTISFEMCNERGEVFASTPQKDIQLNRGDYFKFKKLIHVKELERKMTSGEGHMIIRCLMSVQKIDTTETPSKRSFRAATEIGYNSFSFLWDTTYSGLSNWSETKVLSINESTQLTIDIKAPNNTVLFEIKRITEKTSLLRVKCQIVVLNIDSTEKLSCTDFFAFEEGSSVWHFPSFVDKSLLDEKYKLLFLKFNFSISNGFLFKKDFEEIEQPNLPSSAAHAKKETATDCLIDDFRAMLLNKDHSDVSFRVEGEEVSAHKFVLASRSPVFSAMLNQKMVEQQSGVIEISDMDMHTLKLFLKFLYTGEIENLDCEKALELLLVAEKYQVLSLKEKCADILRHCLDCDNACRVVSVADMVGHKTLKTFAIDYIKDNSSEILGTAMWLEWIKKNSELCSDILHSLSLDLKTIQKKK